MDIETLDRRTVASFFLRLRNKSKTRQCDEQATIIVTHLLPDRPFFLRAITEISDLVSVVPKPKTMDPAVKGWAQHQYRFDQLDRATLSDGEKALAFVEERAQGKPLVILDIGGYFSKSLAFLVEHYSGGISGVVEDTENGLLKYISAEKVQPFNCPVLSVARSPLKVPEDYLVGQSIVFSVEALLRERGDILHGRTACVIGYGKLGSSIAALLHARHVRTVVYDTSTIKAVEAMAHGFSVSRCLGDALESAGLVFCASGNLSLPAGMLKKVQDGAYVATVTSSEDELDMDGISGEYRCRHVTDFVSVYESANHHFFLLNRGQAVNFLHGAAVGSFIYLVQGELYAALSHLHNGGLGNGIQELPGEVRGFIAKAWLESFVDASH